MLNKDHKLALRVQALILYELGIKIDDVIKITEFSRQTIYALKAKATKKHTHAGNIHLEGRTCGGNIETEGIYTQKDINTKGIYSWKDALIEGTYTEGYIHKKTYTRKDTHIEEHIHGEYIHMWKKYTGGGHTHGVDKYTK